MKGAKKPPALPSLKEEEEVAVKGSSKAVSFRGKDRASRSVHDTDV